jgi:GNAT superfamily N-acetyltransferase
MERERMDWAGECAAAEGWNPGLHDATCFFDTDPLGFLVATLGDEPVGCISAVSYGHGFGFIGLYIVVPEFRGRGYGLALWKAAMERLRGHNIGLDGVVEQQENYRKSGFHLAYRNVRYEGAAAPGAREDTRLVHLTQVPRRFIDGYDLRCFPVPRTRFLDGWLSMPASEGIACVEGAALRGYGVIRACRRGYKIGPLFADGPDRAEAILSFLLSRPAAGAPVYLDVPEANGHAVAMAERHDMTRVFETARMYSGPDPAVDLPKTFGVTTFELG